MPQLLPRMTSQPPPEYVAFVARHLRELRRDALRLAGDENGADELYPLALTAVAARWTWFELLRTRLGRPYAADAYLYETLVRRSTRTLPEGDGPTEIDVWCSTDARVALHPPPRSPPQRQPGCDATLPEPARSNVALRLLPMVVRELGVEVGPVAEAAVAWWHAYEAHRRMRLIAVVVAVGLLLLAMIRLAGG